VYVGTSGGGVQVTADDGATWSDISGAAHGLPIRYVTDLIVHRSNASIAYVTLSGFQSGHVYRTTNRGQTWTNISGNLPDMPVNAIVLLPDGDLVVGTDLGVYRSSNGGGGWSLLSTGMPNVAVIDLMYHKSSSTLVAATHGRGMFGSVLTVNAPVADIAVRVNPFAAVPGAPIRVQPVVALVTAGGDVATAASPVTISIASGSGTLSGTTTVNAVNGVATFTDVRVDGSGTHTFRFTSGTLPTVTSAPFDVGYLRGDVTDDGIVNALDAQMVLSAVVKKTLPVAYRPTPNGDADCDSVLRARDASIILSKLVGRNVSSFCVGLYR
jgi:hypothetical protein